MNTKVRFALILALVLLTGAALMAVTWAAAGNMPLAPGGSPAMGKFPLIRKGEQL